MTGYWSRVEPFWDNCPTDDPEDFLAFYEGMPPAARDLLTTHWVVSEVSNGGFHQLFTNPTGVLVPEAVAGFRSMALVQLADITAEAASFFGEIYPRDQMARIEALERYAACSASPDDWNPFERLDDEFYSAFDLGGGQDAYTSSADIHAN